MTLRENLSQSPTILGMTNSSTAVMMLCVVFRLVEGMYVIDDDGDVDGSVAVAVVTVLMVEVRTETETATDALIDGNPADGLIISLRSL